MNPQRIAQLQALIEMDPDDPFLPYAVAQEYVSGELWREACLQFESLLLTFPGYLPAYYHFGIALARLGMVSKALEILHQGFLLAIELKDRKTAAEIEGLIEDLE